MDKKDVRKKFRDGVLARDNNTCKVCGKDDLKLDAHHITDRHEMLNGGYVLENGIALCDSREGCHMKAEKFHISGGTEWEEGFHPNNLYKLIGSSKELGTQKSSEL